MEIMDIMDNMELVIRIEMRVSRIDNILYDGVVLLTMGRDRKIVRNEMHDSGIAVRMENGKRNLMSNTEIQNIRLKLSRTTSNVSRGFLKSESKIFCEASKNTSKYYFVTGHSQLCSCNFGTKFNHLTATKLAVFVYIICIILWLQL